MSLLGFTSILLQCHRRRCFIYPSITPLSTIMYISTIQKEGERERRWLILVSGWDYVRTLSMKLGRTTHLLWNEWPGNFLHCLMKSPHLMANKRRFSELHQEIWTTGCSKLSSKTLLTNISLDSTLFFTPISWAHAGETQECIDRDVIRISLVDSVTHENNWW